MDTDLKVTSHKFDTNVISNTPEKSSVAGEVDLLCETKTQKIAIEMQRTYQFYFLARTQHYKSKLISDQVNVNSSHDYHNDILNTFILVIGKEDLFKG